MRRLVLSLVLVACSSTAEEGERGVEGDASPGDASGSDTSTFDAPAADAPVGDVAPAETPSETSSPAAADPYFGLSPDEATWGDAQAATFRALGAGTVRFQLCDWPASKASIDARIAAAKKAGLSVYVELNYCTLSAPSAALERQRYWHAGFTDAGNDFAWKFANAAGEIAAYLKGRVDRYELWNEPDAAPRPKTGWPTTKWASATNADWDGACGTYDYGVDYGQGAWALCPRQLGVLTTNAFMKIRAEDPAPKIVAGNLLFHGDDAWVAKEYWKQVEASGAVAWHRTNKGRLPWDEVGIHPYGYDPISGKLQAQVTSFRAVLTGASDASAIVLSEYGWHTSPAEDPNMRATEADQAAYLKATFLAMKPAVSLVMWFNYLAAPGLSYGIRRADLSWKPAAHAYCDAAGATACPAP